MSATHFFVAQGNAAGRDSDVERRPGAGFDSSNKKGDDNTDENKDPRKFTLFAMSSSSQQDAPLVLGK